MFYRLAALARGIEPIEVPLTAAFELDEPAVIRAIEEHRPSVVFLALPNNPTGTLWRMSFATELAKFRDVAIVSDEAYVAYSGSGQTIRRLGYSHRCAALRGAVMAAGEKVSV